MQKGSKLYYGDPMMVAMAEENSGIKWQFKCAACKSRAPLESSKDCSRNFRWNKKSGCIEWRLDEGFDRNKLLGEK